MFLIQVENCNFIMLARYRILQIITDSYRHCFAFFCSFRCVRHCMQGDVFFVSYHITHKFVVSQ